MIVRLYVCSIEYEVYRKKIVIEFLPQKLTNEDFIGLWTRKVRRIVVENIHKYR